jgi:DNA-binding response OmpR family regulator
MITTEFLSMDRTILLVDDDVHILRAAEFKLKKAGYVVLCASDGEEAWQMIQQHVPQLVVTDLQMPRLSGTELIERIRGTRQTADLPVIILTAKGFELAPADLARQWGVAEVVSKPFSPRALCDRVQALMEERMAKAAAAAPCCGSNAR